ncbi:hypothetical protein P280DRAFT_400418 [Massarina eburnea CBS 473.64]|uniref:Uncharacterized protein n=1 Tax=Massarina eburnea CBS 473.64 TaxID=1395130 RepID=A0A6A6RZ53_9PLEO|nr:hypothetical protein P280DRAFT_400418 [Massarina eburnea CBS 473.64]
MRLSAALLCTVVHALTANANVEKTIFLGPRAVALPDVDHSVDATRLDGLRIDVLDPASPILATRLPVQFPSETAPRGAESWYVLQGLEDGRRYETRLCWPATQPTDFWLDTFTIPQLFARSKLLHSIADYADVHAQVRKSLALPDPRDSLGQLQAPQSLLFLRVQAAASYFTTNETLMREPRPVDVDIILDPFILNVLPRSLGPTAIYISIVSVFAWFLSAYIYRCLVSFANEPLKVHTQ